MSEALPAVDWTRGVPLMAGPYFLGLYQPSPETRDFWDGVARHEIRLKWCPHCATAMHPKRIVCTFCGSTELGTHRACGRGTIYSFSVVHRAPSPAFQAAVPYAVGVVRLEEGVHLFTRLFPPIAALASEASGQRGHSIVRAHSASEDARKRANDTRPEPGSSARAALAIDAPVQVDFRVLELGNLLPVFMMATP